MPVPVPTIDSAIEAALPFAGGASVGEAAGAADAADAPAGRR